MLYLESGTLRQPLSATASALAFPSEMMRLMLFHDLEFSLAKTELRNKLI